MGLGNRVANGKVWSKNKVKKRKKVLLLFEILTAVMIIAAGVIWYVPPVKAAVAQMVATSSWGKYIISILGKETYDNSVYDIDFDADKVLVNDELQYDYDEEYTNFVMFGIDSRTEQFDDQTNSDTIIIVSVHNTTGEVKMMSVYRDTYLRIVKNDGSSYYSKINSAYASGGATAALNTINTNFDLNIKDYVVVNFSGVTKLIDALGGVDVNLTDGEVAQLNQHLKSTIVQVGEYSSGVTSAGPTHLNGL
ncbi:MAG: LCP family protein, partial [Eubacterium sp.]